LALADRLEAGDGAQHGALAAAGGAEQAADAAGGKGKVEAVDHRVRAARRVVGQAQARDAQVGGRGAGVWRERGAHRWARTGEGGHSGAGSASTCGRASCVRASQATGSRPATTMASAAIAP